LARLGKSWGQPRRAGPPGLSSGGPQSEQGWPQVAVRWRAPSHCQWQVAADKSLISSPSLGWAELVFALELGLGETAAKVQLGARECAAARPPAWLRSRAASPEERAQSGKPSGAKRQR